MRGHDRRAPRARTRRARRDGLRDDAAGAPDLGARERRLRGARRVSRAMWRGLWPGLPVDEVPIGHVTNAVHAPTWLAPELAGPLRDAGVEPEAAPGRGRLGRLRRRSIPPPSGGPHPGEGEALRAARRRSRRRREPRPGGAHDRLREALRRLQAGRPPLLGRRPPGAAPLRSRAPRPDRLRRQGASRGRGRQGAPRPDRRPRPRPAARTGGSPSWPATTWRSPACSSRAWTCG